jgi:rRNA processing protein Gar1
MEKLPKLGTLVKHKDRNFVGKVCKITGDIDNPYLYVVNYDEMYEDMEEPLEDWELVND